MRRLSMRLPVRGDPATLRRQLTADPRSWLPSPARPRGVDRWTVDLAAGRVHRRVACGVGMVWDAGQVMWRAVTWEPVVEPDELLATARVLPTFRGKLTLTTEGDTALALEGSYRPPAGVLGAVIDKILLHQVAEATAASFLREVAARLRVTSEERPGIRPANRGAGVSVHRTRAPVAPGRRTR